MLSFTNDAVLINLKRLDFVVVYFSKHSSIYLYINVLSNINKIDHIPVVIEKAST